MGNAIGLVARMGVGRLKRFNVNNRARRVIDVEKPKRAPTFEVNLKETEQIATEFPEVVKTLESKDNALLQNLQNLYVVAKQEDNSMKKVESGLKGGHLYRHEEVSQLPSSSQQGLYEITHVIDAVKEFKDNPNPSIVPNLSKKYKINEDALRNIVTYVKVFDMYAPPKTKLSYLERAGKEMMPSMENHMAKEEARYQFVKLHYKRIEEDLVKRKQKGKSSPVDVKSQSTGKPLDIDDKNENDKDKSRFTSDKKSQ